jgi:hypothetical protein
MPGGQGDRRISGDQAESYIHLGSLLVPIRLKQDLFISTQLRGCISIKQQSNKFKSDK